MKFLSGAVYSEPFYFMWLPPSSFAGRLKYALFQGFNIFARSLLSRLVFVILILISISYYAVQASKKSIHSRFKLKTNKNKTLVGSW